MRQNLVAVAELLTATLIWGFGFTATIWAMASFSSIAVSVLRFSIAFLLTLPIIYMVRELRHEFTRANLKLAALPGLLLGSTLILQTWGLEHTTATKSGFITTLYIVIVPIVEVLILRKRIHRLHALWVAIALAGTALIVQLKIDHINFGDVLTLLCAFFAAFHIALLSKIGPQVKSPFLFNTFQSFWAAMLALSILPFFPGPHFKGYDFWAAIGLFSLTVGSTMLAFALQVKAQKKLTASLSSLIFLLESPFAMLFAILLLGETLSMGQGIGAILISVAAFGAVKFEAA